MILKKNHSQVTQLAVFSNEAVQGLAVSAVAATDPHTEVIAVDIAQVTEVTTPQIRCLLLAMAVTGGIITTGAVVAETQRASSSFWEFAAHAAFPCSFSFCAKRIICINIKLPCKAAPSKKFEKPYNMSILVLSLYFICN